MSLERRFARKTLWKDDGPDSCLLWCGCLTDHGYGQIRVMGRIYLAHRVAWEMENGAIPKGLMLAHTCGEPACVRLSHLKLSRPYRKLSPSQILAIRAAYGSLGEIAKRYGVSRTHVSDIKSGKRRGYSPVV